MLRLLLCCLLAWSVSFGQPTQTTITNTTLTDVWMVDASTGYAGGIGGIFKTTNGGVSWTQLPAFVDNGPFGGNNQQFLAMTEHHLYFTDATHGISVGRNNINNFEEIVTTSDGGATWTIAHYVNPNTSAFQTTELRLRRVVRTTGGVYIAVGYRGRILTSNDDGATWSVKTSNTSANLESISFYDATHAAAVGEKVILTTTDGGNTWTARQSPYHLTQIHTVSSTVWLATTVDGLIVRSQDAGLTWMELYGPVGPFTSMKFITSQLGFITASNVVYKTTDGGTTFSDASINPPGNPAQLTAISTLSETSLYFVTNGGKFLSSQSALTFTATNGFYSMPTVCAGVASDFKNIGAVGNTYRWYVNNVEVGQGYHLNYSFPLDGLMEVKLTSTGGSQPTTITKTVLVKPAASTAALTLFEINFKPVPDTVELAAQIPAGTLRFGVQVLNTSFQLFRNGLPISSEVTYDNNHPGGVEFDVPLVSTAGAYQYNVKSKATNNCGTAVRDNVFNIVVLDVPVRPKNLELFHTTGNGVIIKWAETSKQVTHYDIERREEGTTSWTVVGTVPFDAPAETRSFTDAGLTPLKHYFYRVAAKNAVGSSRYSDIKGISIFDHVIYVNKSATGNNRGTSWTNAFTDFDLAAKSSVSDLEIWVAKGDYFARAEYTWSVTTKGMYGGFVGGETLRDQRNSRANKTTLTADLGVLGVRNDNAPNILTLLPGGVVDGFYFMGATNTALTTYGLVENCVVQSNLKGIVMKTGGEVANSLIRKNSFGILRDANNYVVSSFIYANDFGIGTNDPPTPIVNLYHSLYYQNLELGQVPAGNNNIASFIGSTQNFKTLEYIAGGDRILGNEDDILHYPEPSYIDAATSIGTIGSSLLSGFTKDFEGNARVLNQPDVGPIEYGPDPWALPPAPTVASATSESITLQWPLVSDATVTRIWIVVTLPTGAETLFAVAKDATSFQVPLLTFNSTYTFRLRFEHDQKMSRPSVGVQGQTTKKTQAIQGFDDLNVPFSPNTVALPSLSTGGRTIAYSAADNTVASISGNTLTLKKSGTTTITATVSEDADFFGLSVTKNLVVTKGTQVLTEVNNRSFTLTANSNNTITLPINSSVQLPVVYTSGNTAVATVNGNVITVISAGTVVISATQSGNSNYNPASGQFTLTVTIGKQDQTLNGLSTITKVLGDADFVPNVVASSGLPVTFSSSNASVASIVGGAIHLVSAGQVTITVSQAGNAFYNPVSGEFALTITTTKQDQTLFGLNNVSKVLGSPDFSPGVTASSGLPVTLSSGNTSIATIVGASIHLVAVGQVTITVSQVGNANYNATSGTFQLTVTNVPDARANQTLSFPATIRKSIAFGSFNLPIIVSSGLTATVTSSNAAVATVNGYQVTLHATGSAVLTIEQAGNGSYLPVSGQATLTVVADTQDVSMPNAAADYRYGMAPIQLSATSTAGLPVTYLSSNSSIIEIDTQHSTAIVKGVGNAVIFASVLATDLFPAVDKSVSLNVKRALPTFQGLADRSVTYGDSPFLLNLTHSKGLPFRIEVLGGIRLNGNQVEIVQAGLGTIVATSDGDNLNEPITSVATITIAKATDRIEFAPIADQPVGASVVLNARTVKTDSQALLQLSSPKASIIGNTLTTQAPGKLTVTASFIPTVNYLDPEPVQRTFCILPPVPSISFNGVKLTSDATSTQWYRNGSLVAESPSNELLVTDDGSYTAKAVVEGCESASTSPLIVTAVEDAVGTRVVVYPNPTEDSIHITGAPSGASVRVTNMIGQQMLGSRTDGNGELELSLRTLASGFYLLAIDGHGTVIKIRKQ